MVTGKAFTTCPQYHHVGHDSTGSSYMVVSQVSWFLLAPSYACVVFVTLDLFYILFFPNPLEEFFFFIFKIIREWGKQAHVCKITGTFSI